MAFDRSDLFILSDRMMTETPQPDFEAAPRQALIDALRNNTLGPSNLSAQNKRDLVEIARRSWAQLSESRRAALADSLSSEIAYQNDRKHATVRPR